MNKKTPIAALVAAALLSACVSAPERRTVAAPPAPVSLTKVYFYPQQGQSEAQQDRDRYECYLWASRQTGFDPSRRIAPREARAAVVPARDPNADIAAAGATGAVIGAIAAPPGDTGKGALIGAVAGAMLGAVAANAEAKSAPAAQPARIGGRYEQEAAEYRRAMSACLEGRGYSVR
jgi:hypothetical protein